MKQNIVYSQLNDLSFYKDSFYWSNIDTLILNQNNINLKDIICASHNNNVRSILLIDQIEFFEFSKQLNFTKLLNLIESNGSDGILLNVKSNINLNSIKDIQRFNKLLKSKNKYYYFSISVPLTFNNIFNDDLILNCDYLILQSFNTINYTGINEIEYGNEIPGDYVRQTINKNWLTKYNNTKEKIILGVSLMGNQKCCNTGGGRNNIFNLNYCEKVLFYNDGINQFNPIDINYNDIYNYILGVGEGYFSSGELWNFKSHTPFLNFRIYNNDTNIIYQIQYENTKSIYYKIVNTGVGGISMWGIDSLYKLKKNHLNNILTLFDKNITKSTFNNNINIF